MPSTDPPEPSALRPVQRIAVHAVVTEASGGVLLLPASTSSGSVASGPTSSAAAVVGPWTLPGGGLRHGEHPRDGVLRVLRESTGLVAGRLVGQVTPRSAGSDVLDLPAHGVSLHTLRLFYDVVPPAEMPREPARFVGPDVGAGLPLRPFVADLLGLPRNALLGPDGERPDPPWPEPAADPAESPVPPEVLDLAEDGEVPVRMQRPAAYAVLIDETADEPADGAMDGTGPRMLLTRLAGSQSIWTLPGGGIDHGEPPLVALERELYEETGLPYLPGPLIDIGSRHFVGRSPRGGLEDFHGLRLVYAGSVPVDRPPEVIEVDGSTDLAAWIPVSELARTGAVAAVRESYAIWREHRDRQRSAG